MKQIVYRGVEHGEALRVVQAQRYEREERRLFLNGARAKAVFGSGVYLVSNPEIAAQYAICHAETMWDKAAVLRQELLLPGLFCLDERYGENELRMDALRTRHSTKDLKSRTRTMDTQEWLEWTGDEVRLYLISCGYRGIRYRISPDLTYYICYEPDAQISQISILSVLDVSEIT
ncbi:hypothetical protein BRE01_59780 [Brevibacillus reuszeri]|uniref:RES domain-containing protein n=1 Tax=Brevibacillus reuszeri TaxID=54915 RepID=A0A0K9YNH8_9BACL|nr:hypothetical protein [Brevibacillus reuszeri]KNB70269.1 hypothetical protein ADS79_14990 [Brevibacillus reuszeri]MED1859228.1 hypothetical protein [Brevibacillus reuszeri]GED72276.1 hypothetical protein BRE01_59780 [Brevibacillus reuszeri]